jgi:lambda family phage tail tape measure protein
MAGPNDLPVNLTIDASIFQKGLEDAVKQLNDFSAKIKAAGDSVNTTMANIKKSTDPVSEAFQKLGSTIATIGLGTFIESIAEGGAKISRLAESVSMTTESVLEYSRAMTVVGKDTSTLVTSFGFMEKAVEGAIQGNQKLRADFSALGISVNEFNKLTPEEVYERIARGLAAIQDPARRAQAAYDILGRSVKGVDWVKYVAELDRTKGTMAEAARGSDAAAAAFSSMAVFMNDLKNQILIILTPFLQLITYFTDMADKLGLAKVAGTAVLVVFGLLTAAGIYKGFVMLKEVIYDIGKGMLALEVELAPIVGWFVVAAGAAAIAYAVYERLTGQVDSLGDGFEKLGTEIGGFVGDAWKKLTDNVNAYTGAAEKAKDVKLPISTEKPVDPYAEQLESLKNQYALQEFIASRAKERLGLEINLVSASESARAAKLAEFDDDTKHFDTLIKYSAQIGKLAADQKQGHDHSEEIAQLQKMEALEIARHDTYKDQAGELVKAKQARADELNYLELQEKVNNNIKEINRQITEATLTDNQKKIVEIQKWADTELAAYVKILKARGDLGNDVTQSKEYKDRAAALQNFVTQEQDATQKGIDAARSWSNEWQKSINQYVEDAGNGATAAKKLFEDATKGMEDVIVNFAKTGKLNFDQLLQNIAEDILRSQIKQLFAGLFNSNGLTSSGGGGSSLFAGVGKLLGFADGGTIPTNGPVMVGENGPEIISGAAGMSVTPNSQIGQSGQNQSSMANVTYNINATDARSFQQMIAQDPSFLYAVTLRGQNMIPGAAGGL